jgi:hypothetical protein
MTGCTNLKSCGYIEINPIGTEEFTFCKKDREIKNVKEGRENKVSLQIIFL